MASKRGVKRRAERKKCGTKRRHANVDDARIHLRRVLRADHRQGRDAKLMTVYRCEFCGYYHVGHQLAKAKEKMQERRGY